MIRQFKRNSPYSYVANAFFLIIIFFHNGAESATLNGVLNGDELRWTNAIEQGGYYTLSNWQPVSGLAPTTEWSPGTFIGQPLSELTMTNGFAEQVTVNIQLAGIQYGLGGAASHFTQRGQVISSINLCDNTQQSQDSAIVIGHDCIANESYLASSSYTPFQFVRPILALNKMDIVQAFQNADLPSGTYTGTIFARPAYIFRTPTGSWTYRNALSVPISVSIRYEAANLLSVSTIGTGVMQPRYDTTKNTVSGEAIFAVQTIGFFTNGIKLTFSDDDGDNQFLLDHEDPALDSHIPYSIDCPKCEVQEIVKDGKLMVDNGETILQGEGKEINFILRSHYDSVGVNQVETGMYRDTFVVYFEENL